MNIDIGVGIQTLVNRMESHPEEFFGDASKWHFMFQERFRDTMTESEKGAIHGALKEVRRKEFEHKVMRTLLEGDIMKDQMVQSRLTGGVMGAGTGTITSSYFRNGINIIEPQTAVGAIESK